MNCEQAITGAERGDAIPADATERCDDEALKTAVWDLMQEMRLGMLVRRVRQLEDENASFKRQIYELKVMCIRAENRKRWSGSDSDYPWFEMPRPEGRLPSEIVLAFHGVSKRRFSSVV